MLALDARTRIEPLAVFDEKVCPTGDGARIRVRHGRSDRRPTLLMTFDKRVGPAWTRIGMVFGESDDGSGSGPHSGGAGSRRGDDGTCFDNGERNEISQGGLVEPKGGSRRRDDHNLELRGDVLSGQMRERFADRRESVRSDDDD